MGWPKLQSRVFISHVTFSDVTSVWGVSAVAILDCSLTVYASDRQKALTMSAYCVAATCNNSQATQSITMHEFPRNRPARRRKWVKFVQFKRADFDAAPQSRPFVYRALCWVRFRKLYGGIPNGVCFKAEFVGLSTGLPTRKKFQFESPRMKLTSSKRTAWYQKLRDTLIPWNKC